MKLILFPTTYTIRTIDPLLYNDISQQTSWLDDDNSEKSHAV